MKINFLSDRDKGLFQNSRQLVKSYGALAAKRLVQRLDDLDAAQSMEDMRTLPGHWEELKKERAGQFSARLHGGLRLIVKPQKQPPPVKPDGGLDWRAIDSFYIVEVVDYHE